MKVFHDFVQSTRNKTGQSMKLSSCPFGRKGFSFELANFIIPPSSFFSEVLKVSTKAAESFHLHFFYQKSVSFLKECLKKNLNHSHTFDDTVFENCQNMSHF